MFIGVEQHVFIFFHIYEKLFKIVVIFLHPTQKMMLRRQEMHKISKKLAMKTTPDIVRHGSPIPNGVRVNADLHDFKRSVDFSLISGVKPYNNIYGIK